MYTIPQKGAVFVRGKRKVKSEVKRGKGKQRSRYGQNSLRKKVQEKDKRVKRGFHRRKKNAGLVQRELKGGAQRALENSPAR